MDGRREPHPGRARLLKHELTSISGAAENASVPRERRKPRISEAFMVSAPERIRTSDLRFRRPTLYPAELRALVALRRGSLAPASSGAAIWSTSTAKSGFVGVIVKQADRAGFEPAMGL